MRHSRLLTSSISVIASVAVVCSGLVAPLFAAVVISEVHYHPPEPDGNRLEFVEIWNSGDVEIDIGNWRFQGGIQFTFPMGTKITPECRLLVCKDREAFDSEKGDGCEGGGRASRVQFETFEGSLANEGETIVLVDAGNARVDALSFDDQAPWPTQPDGEGMSLQRLCADAPSSDPANWREGLPTPFASFAIETCDLPAAPEPSVVISEIFYHPPREVHGGPVGVDEETEFVELHNLLNRPVEIAGWAFIDGIDFTFPADVSIPAGGYLVVARDPELLTRKFDSVHAGNVVGPFEGQLANAGERLTLVNGATVVDSVMYGDSDATGGWPYSPDGEGRSLEKVFLAGPGRDAANWGASRVPRDQFVEFEIEGPLGPFADENANDPAVQGTFVISLDGPGEAIIDNVILEDTADPGKNLLLNAGFEDGLAVWLARGNAADSQWDFQAGVRNSGALRLIANGPCPYEGCTHCLKPVRGQDFEPCQGGRSFNGLTQAIAPTLLKKSSTYRIAVSARSISGSFEIQVGFGEGTRVRTCLASPGAPNSVQSDRSSAIVTGIGRSPLQPRSVDTTTITAVVRSEGGPGTGCKVRLVFGADERGDRIEPGLEIELLDDGASGDRESGDGVYGGTLPAFRHNTQVRYRIFVEEQGVETVISPRPLDRDFVRRSEVWGYYVNDDQPSSPLPVYHVLIDGVDGSDFKEVDGSLSCETLASAAFAVNGELYPEVGLRFRGNTACYINKRNFKLRFNRGRYFDGDGARRLKKMNLNGLWTDKAIVREKLAWDLVRDIGAPYVDNFYTRVHVSGNYYGLFIYIEHPDNFFLSRNGLDTDGSLYKAVQPSADVIDSEPGVRLLSSGRFHLAFEEETNRGRDYKDLERFVSRMWNDSFIGPTREFWQAKGLEDMIIRFHLSNVLLQNYDSSKKNHFLYHDLSNDRWGIINWDLDLSFGKFFNPVAVQRDGADPFFGRQVGTLNDELRGNIKAFVNPWVMTSLGGNRPEEGNALVDFFFKAGDGYYRRAYLVRLWDLLMEKMSDDVMGVSIDELVELLRDEIHDDLSFWGRYPSNIDDHPDDLDSNIGFMKTEIDLARGFLLEYLDKEILARFGDVNHSGLKITELLYYPPGGDLDRQFVELVNTSTDGVNGVSVDVSGWTVEGIDFEFPPGSVIGPGEVIILTRNASLFEAIHSDRKVDHLFAFSDFLSSDGELLRVRDDGPGDTYPATVDYLDYGVRGEWPSARPGFSIELSGVSRHRDNDLGRHWRHSLVEGGSPGSVRTLFLRGDSNWDGRTDVTDALPMLLYLFLDVPVQCLDALDADDSGLTDITDPIHLLKHLFFGETPPPPPYPGPGSDPTFDGLGCQALELPNAI